MSIWPFGVFDAVECHWPYAHNPRVVEAALADTALVMLGLNTARGDVQSGDNGLAAVPGRQAEARAAIDQALAYAAATGTANVHVMAGKAEGIAAQDAFLHNLAYATAKAALSGITILIEPLNRYDAPGYFLQTTAQAEGLIAAVAAPNLKLMFDCYHVQIMEGDLSRRLERLLPVIGHIQIAAVPSRREPGDGEVDYRHIVRLLQSLGYDRPLGAEYRPATSTEAGLGWMQELRQASLQGKPA